MNRGEQVLHRHDAALIRWLNEALKSTTSNEGQAIRTRRIDADGAEIPYSEYRGEREIEAVRFTFLTGGDGFEAPEWSPKDEENLYAFFRE